MTSKLLSRGQATWAYPTIYNIWVLAENVIFIQVFQSQIPAECLLYRMVMYDVHTFFYLFIIVNRSSQTALVLRSFGDWNSCQQLSSSPRLGREKSAAPTHAVFQCQNISTLSPPAVLFKWTPAYCTVSHSGINVYSLFEYSLWHYYFNFSFSYLICNDLLAAGPGGDRFPVHLDLRGWHSAGPNSWWRLRGLWKG